MALQVRIPIASSSSAPPPPLTLSHPLSSKRAAEVSESFSHGNGIGLILNGKGLILIN